MRNTIVTHCSIVNLDAKTYRSVCDLTHRDDGAMRDIARDIRKHGLEGEAFIAMQDELLLGWALLFPYTYRSPNNYKTYVRYELHIYVRKSVRRQGIGSQLYRAADRFLLTTKRRHPWILPPNPQATAFYKACDVSKSKFN